MKYLPYYIPFFGPLIAMINNEESFFNLKNPHFYATAMLHGIVLGIIVHG